MPILKRSVCGAPRWGIEMLQWFNRNERIVLVLFWVSQALLHYVFDTLTVLDDIARNHGESECCNGSTGMSGSCWCCSG